MSFLQAPDMTVPGGPGIRPAASAADECIMNGAPETRLKRRLNGSVSGLARSGGERPDGGGEGRRLIDPREVRCVRLDDDGSVVEQRCRLPYHVGRRDRVELSGVQQDGCGESLQGGPGRRRVEG